MSSTDLTSTATEFTEAELGAYAPFYTQITKLWNDGTISGYWTTFQKDWWPRIVLAFSVQYVWAAVFGIFASVNLVIVNFNTTGLNSFAVILMAGKKILAD